MYEPAIVINGRGVQATSRTAQPLLGAGEETVYHRACYEPLAGDGDVPEGAAAD